MHIDILEAEKQLRQLVESVQAGEDITITRNRVPIARLVAPDQPGMAGNIVDWLVAHPLPEHLRRGHAEIARAIATERDAWNQ